MARDDLKYPRPMAGNDARPESLSNASRALTLVVAILWALTGVVFFVLPSWSQARFPWVVSDFVTMTIGGWCLGTAFLAWWAWRVWTWGAIHPSLMYLWAFGVLELGVVIWFADLLRTDEVLTWPYLVTIAATVLAGVVGVVDVIRLRPTTVVTGPPVPRWLRTASVAFVVIVGFLAFTAALAPDSALDGRIFPEPLSFFTLRAFGAFYLALAFGGVAMAFARNVTPIKSFMASATPLLILITVAAFVFIDTFDLSAHPLQILYIAAYLVVLVVAAIVLWPRANPASTEPSAAA
jgi:hypothetical protein